MTPGTTVSFRGLKYVVMGTETDPAGIDRIRIGRLTAHSAVEAVLVSAGDVEVLSAPKYYSPGDRVTLQAGDRGHVVEDPGGDFVTVEVIRNHPVPESSGVDMVGTVDVSRAGLRLRSLS